MVDRLELKDPLSRRPLTITSARKADLEVIGHQRKPRPAHLKALTASMERMGFITPLVAVERDGKYVIIDGQHRFQAGAELGVEEFPVVVVPELLARRMMSLNIEQSLNIRERSTIALSIYREMLDESPLRAEDDGEVVDAIETAHLLTLGLAYEGSGRLAGSAFEPILKKCDGFLDQPLKEAYEVREGRAESVLTAAKCVKAVEDALKAEGAWHSMARYQIISYANPTKRARKPSDFDKTFAKFIATLEELEASPHKVLRGEGRVATRELVRYQGLFHDSDRWRGFLFRPGDIVISTPPKCGTTWVQMICALLVLQEPMLQQPLSILSPWLDMLSRARRDVVADLEAQPHRRFIKTHTPLDGLPLDPSVTYICVGRDPRDVALSMDNHRDNIDIDAFMAAREVAAAADGIVLDAVTPLSPPAAGERKRFWQWVDDDTAPATAATSGSSLLRTLRHLQTFWEAPEPADVVMLHYDDLREDLAGQMRAVANRLSITVPEERWSELVVAATFDEMRARAARVAPNAHQALWRDDERFFNRGTSGQWRDLLDDEDLERYRARVRAIGPSDLVHWAHRGTL